jgi:hypothetical protein
MEHGVHTSGSKAAITADSKSCPKQEASGGKALAKKGAAAF